MAERPGGIVPGPYIPHRGGVYLLHLSSPMYHAQHYLGYAENIEARLERHWAGNGAKMLSSARRKGYTWEVARIWPGAARGVERQLKRKKNGRKLCPICHPTGRRGDITYMPKGRI